MTDNKILILYGDLRQQALYNYLKKRKFNVEISSNLGTLSSILDNACNFNIIACPIPFTKNNETIFDVSKSTEAMSISKFLDFIKPGQLIFGGNIPSYVQIQYKEKNAVVTDLLKDDNFLYMNSYLTAEALIGKIILTIPASLCDMKVLITGYGMCGKAIAKLISPFGCNIFIYNRSNKSILCQFTRYSYSSSLKSIDYSSFDLIINTIPNNIFNEELIKEIRPDCYFFDIASSPFGISKNTSVNFHYEILPSLPGKYSYISAGELIGKCIINKL